MKTLGKYFILMVVLVSTALGVSTYTEFYCNASTGANINAGDLDANGVVTSTNGGWSTSTNVFTAASGTPFSGVGVGDFASVYADGATVTGYIGRVTAVGGGGATLTISSSAKSGTAPTTAASGISCTTGGAWKGPNAAEAFPFNFVASTMTDSTGHLPRVNFKNNATYNITSNVTHSGTTQVVFQGYTTTAGDFGKATLDGGTSTIILFTLSASRTTIADFIFSNNGTTGTNELVLVSGSTNQFLRCVAHDSRGHGFNGGASYIECEAYACNASNTALNGGFRVGTGSGLYCLRCVSHDNAGSNSYGYITGSGTTLNECIADTNGADGFQITTSSTVYVRNSDFYNNGGDGVDVTTAFNPQYILIENCNFLKNTGLGINNSGSSTAMVGSILNCGFGTGTQANSSDMASGIQLQSMTQIGNFSYASNVTPWTDPANGDFRINLSTAKGTGRGTFTQTAASYTGTIGYPDVGAAQHIDSGGGAVESSFTFGQ